MENNVVLWVAKIQIRKQDLNRTRTEDALVIFRVRETRNGVLHTCICVFNSAVARMIPIGGAEIMWPMREKKEEKRTCNNNNRTQKDHSGVIQTLTREKWEEIRSLTSTGFITNIKDITQCKKGIWVMDHNKICQNWEGGIENK